MNITVYIPIIFTLYIAVVAALILIAYKLLSHKNIQRKLTLQPLYNLSIALFLITIGMVLAEKKNKSVLADFTNQKGVFTLTVIDTPVEKDKTYLCKARVSEKYVNDSAYKTKGNVLIYLQKDSLAADIKEGDILLCNTIFNAYKPTGNPESFDYNAYLFKQSITSTSYIPSHKWRRVGCDSVFSILRCSHRCRNSLMNKYHEYGLDGQNLAVISALTLGYKQQLEPDTKMAYSASGAMHILAVSGLHVGIIYAILYLLLYPIRRKNNKLISSLIIFVFLWCYAFITGLSPSVLRATIMFSVILIGNCFNRKSYIYNTIALSAFFLLIYNPFYLYHVGFQLSYSAVTAIVFLQPKLYKACYFSSKIMDYIWALISVSIAAQVGTFVWSLLYFNQLSTYFLLTNIIVIPIATIILYTAAIFFLVAFLPVIPSWIAFCLNIETSLLNKIVQLIEHLPFSTVHCFVDQYQALALGIAVVSILSAISLNDNKKFWAVCCSLVALLVCLGISSKRLYEADKQQKIVVYNAGNNPVIQLLDGKLSIVYSSDSLNVKYYITNFARKYFVQNINHQLIEENDIKGFVFKGEKYIILQGNILHNKLSNKKIYTDYLIVTDVKDTYVEEITQMIDTKHIIITPALKLWKKNKLKEYCIKNLIQYTDIALDGAYIIE